MRYSSFWIGLIYVTECVFFSFFLFNASFDFQRKGRGKKKQAKLEKAAVCQFDSEVQ